MGSSSSGFTGTRMNTFYYLGFLLLALLPASKAYQDEVCRVGDKVCLSKIEDTPGITYLTALPKMRRGPVTMEVSSSETSSLIDSLAIKTRNSNKASVSSKVSVKGSFMGVGASAELSAGYEYFTETNTTAKTQMTTNMKQTMTSVTTVPENQWGIIAAEMKMYVYRTKVGGKKYRVVAPTGHTIVAAWNKASLAPHILDSTFASVARQFNLNVMEEDQIQQLAGDDVPVVKEDGGSGSTNAVKTFPNEEYVYQILNTVVRGERLGAHGCDSGSGKYWCKATCYYSKYNSNNHFWKFTRLSDGSYTIHNVHRTNYRLTEPWNPSWTFWAYYIKDQNKITDRQRFIVENLGHNKVRIKSKKQGFYLQSTWVNRCKFDKAIKYQTADKTIGGDIWELRAKYMTPY